jgi:hypothetical protein
LDIPITEESFMEWQRSGALIQDAFPALSVDHREFMISGITPDEWQDIMGEDDE